MSTPDKSHAEPVRFLSIKDGTTCRCPYCRCEFSWPPKKLMCPNCGKMVQPPVGFAKPGRERRIKAVEAIVHKAEAEEKKLGKPPEFSPSKKPSVLIAILVVLALVGSSAILSSQKSSATVKRSKKDPVKLTQGDLATYAMALCHFKADIGRFPYYDEGGLLALISDPGLHDWHGPYINVIHRDGWKRPYFYDLTNGVPVLFSAGPDRHYQTADDMKPKPEDFSVHPDFVRHDPLRENKPHLSSVVIGSDD